MVWVGEAHTQFMNCRLGLNGMFAPKRCVSTRYPCSVAGAVMKVVYRVFAGS